jgi:hypothetical protein
MLMNSPFLISHLSFVCTVKLAGLSSEFPQSLRRVRDDADFFQSKIELALASKIFLVVNYKIDEKEGYECIPIMTG